MNLLSSCSPTTSTKRGARANVTSGTVGSDSSPCSWLRSYLCDSGFCYVAGCAADYSRSNFLCSCTCSCLLFKHCVSEVCSLFQISANCSKTFLYNFNLRFFDERTAFRFIFLVQIQFSLKMIARISAARIHTDGFKLMKAQMTKSASSAASYAGTSGIDSAFWYTSCYPALEGGRGSRWRFASERMS